MSFLPKSRKARTRLLLLSVIAPVVAVAVGLTLWGMRGSISLFYTPSQAAEAKPEPGRAIQLGGLVAMGSVIKHPDGRVEFTVEDKLAADKVVFQRDLPDLFQRDVDWETLVEVAIKNRIAVLFARALREHAIDPPAVWQARLDRYRAETFRNNARNIATADAASAALSFLFLERISLPVILCTPYNTVPSEPTKSACCFPDDNFETSATATFSASILAPSPTSTILHLEIHQRYTEISSQPHAQNMNQPRSIFLQNARRSFFNSSLSSSKNATHMLFSIK